MSTLEGKGMFIWKIPNCERGVANTIAAVAQAAGLTHILIKVANGIYPYNFDRDRNQDLVPEVAQALRSRGIQPWGWHYVYGRDPLNEARIAIRRVREMNLDGYVINAEIEYKQPGKKAAAEQFMNTLRSGLPNTPLALSSFRYPAYHPQLPWREFLEKCDYNMPQVYWMHAHNPGIQLRQSVRQFQSLNPFRPIIPTGAAFAEHGWKPAPAEIKELLQTAQILNLSAVNFWSWDASRGAHTDLWNEVANYNWSENIPVADITQQYIDSLNSRDVEKVLNLYLPQAVHINAARTIQGSTAIRSWYNSLFNQLMPNASFTLTGFSGIGNSRHLTWTATFTSGRVLNGNDTFGLSDGKIGYHYTFFTIT